MYLKHTPSIVKPLAKDLVFDLPNDRNAIYLTFDDGPHPEITPRVLDVLASHQAKATFFLIGERAQRFPEVVERIRAEGHAIGMHGQSHISGWKTKDAIYFEDVESCQRIVPSSLFRPPYGQITLSQAKHLKQTYRLILWSDLSADWDDSYTAAECAAFATRKVKSGSIIVFHDSEKAEPRLFDALEASLSYYQAQGFLLEPIAL